MTTERRDWLAQTTEDPIDPDLPICDPHHHLWERPGDSYLLPDLLSDLGSGHNIVETVFLECASMYRTDGPVEMRPLGETAFVQGVADENVRQGGKTRVNAGIVGHADLTLGDGVKAVLEAHLAASPDRFRGIRHASAWDEDSAFVSSRTPPKGLLSDSKFRQGFAKLGELGMSYDAWLYHPQLSELADLAKSFPSVTIILNHIGGPLGAGPYSSKRDQVFVDWQRGIAEIASNQNVVVKLGGLGMPNYGNGWHQREKPPGSAELAETMAPYLMYCIEQFGVDRCMFESNFPVDSISYSYNFMWNAFKRVAGGFSDDERAALFRDTAVRAYRLTNG